MPDSQYKKNDKKAASHSTRRKRPTASHHSDTSAISIENVVQAIVGHGSDTSAVSIEDVVQAVMERKT